MLTISIPFVIIPSIYIFVGERAKDNTDKGRDGENAVGSQRKDCQCPFKALQVHILVSVPINFYITNDDSSLFLS